MNNQEPAVKALGYQMMRAATAGINDLHQATMPTQYLQNAQISQQLRVEYDVDEEDLDATFASDMAELNIGANEYEEDERVINTHKTGF